jgi:hypothetical protein
MKKKHKIELSGELALEAAMDLLQERLRDGVID